jgi:hypothetical protein
VSGLRPVSEADVARGLVCGICERLIEPGELVGESVPAPVRVDGHAIVAQTCADDAGKPYPADGIPPPEVLEAMEGAAVLERLERELE